MHSIGVKSLTQFKWFLNNLHFSRVEDEFFRIFDISTFPKEIKEFLLRDLRYNEFTKTLESEFPKLIKQRTEAYNNSFNKVLLEVLGQNNIQFDNPIEFYKDSMNVYCSSSSVKDKTIMLPDDFGLIPLKSLPRESTYIEFNVDRFYNRVNGEVITKILNNLGFNLRAVDGNASGIDLYGGCCSTILSIYLQPISTSNYIINEI